MSVPHLPDDCIYHILKYVQNHRFSLFNCLLVNRFWSKITVPLLYSDPFSQLMDEKKFLIIKTYFLCLNEEERIYLTKQNNIYKKLKSNSFLSNDLNPIFEYPKYIKKLSKHLVYNTIDYWYKQQINDKVITNRNRPLNDNMSL